MRKNIWKVFFLLFSLLSIACQGDRRKTQVKTLDIPFSSSTETQLSEEAESLDSSSADEKAADQLEIPVGKLVCRLFCYIVRAILPLIILIQRHPTGWHGI